MRSRDALAAARKSLAAISDTPGLDAELLMAKAFGIERETLLLTCLEEPAPDAFEDLLGRRARGEPIAYILGRRAFWTIELEVGPGVLIPRPDSEALIEAALAQFGEAGPRSILDLGTGTGALLLASLDQWREARGIGIDRSERALAVAHANAERLGLSARADFRLGDWSEGITEQFDLILCNPPYIAAGAPLPVDVAEWEPPMALFSGPDGLDDYRRLAPLIGPRLDAQGLACVEIGAGQYDEVASLFAHEGLRTAARRDLAGRRRALLLSH
ncbi:peptide chain release factor N(5)-glutamine methyltransferase [Sphingosinicella rhizophila]|uniref:Release factor glutamine methyltransferase n=1 Tax=Sphingosinicella rhizophila TaxID=3050082 RepID=A0ABU3QBX9_9SPHN|nr:peptide chain release factor N(5)-glutamine methyltransferase [Sphingosinicella sp. GR2756]MDT9600907.1 peptide chain release factor N(5)-glutamine methyltransferase [Sphingosinicella sp. GR2756]